MSECIGDLVVKMHHAINAADHGHKPSFVFNLPFLPDDAASCWEFKRQLLFLDQKLAALRGPYPTHYRVYIQNQPDLQTIRGDIDTFSKQYKEAVFKGAGAAAATPSATPATPDIKELGGLGASFTQFGVIASTISSLLAIAESFHSTISTSTGAIGLDQPTVNSLVVNELFNRGYKVYDFSQLYIGESDYNQTDSKIPLARQNIRELMDTLSSQIASLDGPALPSVQDQNKHVPPSPDVEVKTYVSFFQQIQALSDAKGLSESNTGQLSAKEEDTIKGDLATLANLHTVLPKNVDWVQEYSDYSATFTDPKMSKNVQAILKAANTFAQMVLGVIAPKLPLSSDMSGGDAAGGSNSTLTITLPDGKTLSATFPSAINNGSGGQGGAGQTPSAPQASPINYIEKFSLLEHDLKIIEDKHVKIIAAHVIVSDATQTHVTRQILEDYVALSNRAVIEIQVFDPLHGDYIYSDHTESDHQYVYFPSRVRDGAENKWKDRDFLNHSRDVPYNSLDWFARSDWAAKQATATGRPILVYCYNSDLQPLTQSPDERVFADNDFKTYAAQHLVLLLCNTRSPHQSTAKNKASTDTEGATALPKLELLSSDGKTDLGRVDFDPRSSEDVDSLLDAIQDLTPK